MSMQNPTLSAASQFIGPFDILPNVLYTNPTTAVTTIAPIPIGNKNPTYEADYQFTEPYSVPTRPTSIYILNPNSPSYTYFGKDGKTDWKTSAGNYKDIKGNVKSGPSAIWNPRPLSNTNITLETVGAKAAAFGLSSLGGFTGIPYVTQIGQAQFGQFGEDTLSGDYVTLSADQLTTKKFPLSAILYPDFRSRLGLQNESDKTGQAILSFVASKRFDGASALTRGAIRGGIYAAASALPVGPYSAFNRETLYGWGEHDNPNAIRSDFTLTSHVATTWDKTLPLPQISNGNISKRANGDFIPTRNPIALATPFRGDKISVIDFGKRKLKNAYDWKRKFFTGKPKLDNVVQAIASVTDLTQDFIKFYFTGPALQNGLEDAEDDIIVFRAVITSFSENFNPGWTDVKMIGRADPNYTYTGYTRDVSIDFDIYATDRDELKPIYRKLNALAGYTTPIYSGESIAMQAPWMRLTIGDLYVQTPVVMNSLAYTYAMDAPWEINIEDDPTMMQVPKKISVSCQFNVITDYLPQKGGRFWTLAKKFDVDGTPAAGGDNWLSDTFGNIDRTLIEENKRKTLAGKGSRGGNQTN